MKSRTWKSVASDWSLILAAAACMLFISLAAPALYVLIFVALIPIGGLAAGFALAAHGGCLGTFLGYDVFKASVEVAVLLLRAAAGGR